jgi:hypothetical protein
MIDVHQRCETKPVKKWLEYISCVQQSRGRVIPDRGYTVTLPIGVGSKYLRIPL